MVLLLHPRIKSPLRTLRVFVIFVSLHFSALCSSFRYRKLKRPRTKKSFYVKRFLLTTWKPGEKAIRKVFLRPRQEEMHGMIHFIHHCRALLHPLIVCSDLFREGGRVGKGLWHRRWSKKLRGSLTLTRDLLKLKHAQSRRRSRGATTRRLRTIVVMLTMIKRYSFASKLYSTRLFAPYTAEVDDFKPVVFTSALDCCAIWLTRLGNFCTWAAA